MKALKEMRSQIAPQELLAVEAGLGQDVRGNQMINREVPKRFIQRGL